MLKDSSVDMRGAPWHAESTARYIAGCVEHLTRLSRVSSSTLLFIPILAGPLHTAASVDVALVCQDSMLSPYLLPAAIGKSWEMPSMSYKMKLFFFKVGIYSSDFQDLECFPHPQCLNHL